LLYVAATRTREWLIVCGYESNKRVHPESWYTYIEAAAKRIGREEIVAGETITAIGAPLSDIVVAQQAVARATSALPAFLSRTAPEERGTQTLRPSDTVGAQELALLSPAADGGKRFKRGLLVHALLARLPEIVPDSRERVARAYLTRRGLTPDAASAIVEETLVILRDPSFAPLFAENSRAEVAVAAQLPELGDIRLSGQIDRLAVTGDVVLIADFKTNRPPPASPEQTPRLYIAQMALYRAALAKIYPGKRIDCALVWTDGARLMPLPAARLDAEITAIAKVQARRKF
jgi:ATP-dependent helicase/nuclease subunit A